MPDVFDGKGIPIWGIVWVLKGETPLKTGALEKAWNVNSSRTVTLPECYKILNLSPGAAWADVRRSYHALALKFHPDRNLGDPECEERFKQVSSAFRILKGHYAALGERDVLETPYAAPDPFSWPSGSPRAEGNAGAPGTLKSRATGLWLQVQQWERRLFELDVELRVNITPAIALNGGTIKVRRSRETFDVRVPRGAREGSLLRLPGKGDAGVLHARRGDLLIRLQVVAPSKPDPWEQDSRLEVYLDKRDIRQRRVFSLNTREGEILYTLPVTTRDGQEFILLGKPHPITGTRTRFAVVVRVV